MKVKAYGVFEKGGELKPFEYELGGPKENEIQIRVKYCGICHSDLHLIDNDWDIDRWPLVPGHEIIGEVANIGSEVKNVSEGDIVGVGWQSGSCGRCDECNVGLENICLNMKATCVDSFGGFGEFVNINENFVFNISNKLDLLSTAPMLCGGVTVYNPLQYYNVRPWMKVGVIGMGGLGHLAVQFANKFGCEVEVFTRSQDKEQDALAYGATRLNTSDNIQNAENTFDFILSTVAENLDWNWYLSLLKPRGKLCLVGAFSEPMKIDVFNLIPGQKEIVAGSIGSPSTINQMLSFSERHNITAKVEEFALQDVNVAIKKLRDGSLRYRAVLKI